MNEQSQSQLVCRGIEKFYGRTRALHGVNLTVSGGEVHALCGENGAGKSTLGRIIAGVTAPDAGDIAIDGAPARLDSPARARALGIGMVFQELDLFNELTVAENMTLGNPAVEKFLVDRQRQSEWCSPFLARVGLEKLNPRARLGDQSIAVAQLVAIARALALQARFLLLDEPTSSLTEEAAERLLGLVGELKRSGAGIVYVSHKMREIFRVADRVTVLRDGELVSTKAAADTSIEETISLMVGRALTLGARIQTRPLAEEPPALEIENLQTRRVRGVNLRAARGEVIGIAGLVGSGRSALGEALFGLSPWQAGRVTLAGRPFRPGSPREAIAGGFAYLPEDRREQGLFLRTSIRHNTVAAALGWLRRGPFIDRQRERQLTADELARTRVKAADHTLPVSTLSGGNQQKVLLAKWLLTGPDVLFLDDPTRGVDIGAKADVYQIIESLSAAGKTVLLVSSELSELLRCAHRIMVMHEGRMAGVLNAGGATQENIMTLATGMAGVEHEDKGTPL